MDTNDPIRFRPGHGPVPLVDEEVVAEPAKPAPVKKPRAKKAPEPAPEPAPEE